MRGRLFGLAVSALLLAEAYGLWKPQALGGLPQPDLGPFSHYRLVIALLTAGAGVVVLMASLNRQGGDHSVDERPHPRPLTLDMGAPAAPQAPAPPVAEPPPILAPEPPPMRLAPEPHDDIDELDPFPGLEPSPPPAPAPAAYQPPAPLEGLPILAKEPAPPPPPEPIPVAPEPPTPRGDRGRLLDLTDEAHQFRAAGNLDEALDRYSAALAVARKRAAEQPGELTARRDLATALTHVGDVHDREGRLDAAIGIHEESLAVRRHLADASPGDLAALRGLSTGLERLADAREARGHRSRARDLYRLRLQLAERLSARAPSDPELSAAVTVTRQHLAELDRDLAV